MHQPATDPRRPQQKVILTVTGMHCTNCALSLEKHLLKVGANTPAIDYATGRTSFLAPSEGKIPEIIRSIERLGYTVTNHSGKNEAGHLGDDHHHEHHTVLYIKSAVAAVLTAPMLIAMFLPHSVLHEPWFQFILATPVFIIGVLHFGSSGLRSLRAGVANMDVLISLGIIAGYISSVISLIAGLTGETIFFEATSSIVTFVLIGHLLEDRAVRKTTSAIESLAALQPRKAKRIVATDSTSGASRIEEIDTTEVSVGDMLQVNSGDTIPTDGVIESGELSCDETMISGESLPVDKQHGAKVIGGSVALQGSAVIKASAVGDDTILASIVRLVSEAHQRKPQIQRLGDAVSAVFVPGVIIVSIAVLATGMLFFNLSATQALVRALAIAVVACPCAMGLATPTAIMVALGRAATSGILIRGGDTLERLASVKQIAFDKTGTLTDGRLSVSNFKTYNGIEPDEAKGIIAALQRSSSHPIAKALSREFSNYKSKESFTSAIETKGVGLEGITSFGFKYLCGGRMIMRANGIELPDADIVLLKDSQLVASLNIEDSVRPEALGVIEELKSLGLSTAIISGDTDSKTRSVASKLSIDNFFGERLPEQKLEIIREKQSTGALAYVGDGINDAPTLAEASVGISLSSASDVAMHSSQIILSGDTLKHLPEAIRLARITVKTIKQNLFWAFFYNIVAIPLAACGFISPLAGALIMTGSDVVIVANSLRIKLARIGKR